jgi:glycosyltransferase involved in cell wall biosynthesis
MKEVFGIPMTTTFHGLVPGNVKMLEPDKIRAVLDTTDAFYVNTQFACKQLLDFGCNRDKIHIIPQGTNTADFPFRERAIPENEATVMLSVGRLSHEKGFHIAISAMSRLITENVNVEYRIIGNGIERDNLSEQIEHLGLQNNVKLLGSVSTEELQSHYADAHVFVLPSIDLQDGTHTETQGVVLQEAQSSGLPVIASRTGGIPEVIRDRYTGLLFEQNDEAGLARHVKSLIADPSLYQSLCLNGRKDVDDNYSMEVIRERLLSVYSDIINSKGHS